MPTLEERLDRIRSSPKLQNQQQTAVVLHAIDDTLQAQNGERTPTAYFAALLSLLSQNLSVEQKGIVKTEVTHAVVYLLDLVTGEVSPALLRSKFPQILGSLAPALAHQQAEAPLLRAGIGCLESLLLAQDGHAWSLPQAQDSPRGAVSGLLALAKDVRPKVRKRALEGLAKVLRHPPPSPALDHPAAGMCAESSLRYLRAAVEGVAHKKRTSKERRAAADHEPALMHALQLVKTIATASNGWPSQNLDGLCEVLLGISRGSNEMLTMAAFEVFEVIFAGLADEVSSAKLPRLLEAIQELQPEQSDSQLLPPWIAVLSRGYDVSAQVAPQETFEQLPGLCERVSKFLTSSSHNVRVSASECMVSLLKTCVPGSVILEPSIMDDKTLESVAKVLHSLLNVKFQTAWIEVFNVLRAAFEVFRWKSHPLLDGVIKSIGDLRIHDSFAGKKEADSVLSAALKSAGPDAVLAILPLNLVKPAKGQPGRAWLLPLMRESVSNTRLVHFKAELVPLSEVMFERVLSHGAAEKTMEIKVFETVVSQVWACLPGYCELPLDLTQAFDQSFAEMLSNILYQQPQLRTVICKGLQNLVDTNAAITELEVDGEEEDLIAQGRVSKADAKTNLELLAGFAANLLAVLFNVYSQTLPHNRGNLLQCINAYLSISPKQELVETFLRVATMLESAVSETPTPTQPRQQLSSEQAKNKMPPTSHTLMDLVITMSVHLPRESFASLFAMAANVVQQSEDAQLEKKAYKLIPRLSQSDIGCQALEERSSDLQQLLLGSAKKASAPARRDRLDSIATIIPFLPRSDLHFIPAILSEVVMSTKEVNEKARTTAFDLLVLMAVKMSEGGVVVNSRTPNMSTDAPDAEASLEEYMTMVSAGLAGPTPHTISASITALTRLLYEFRSKLKSETVAEMVQTMDLFLTSNNREIVRSVLGFVKVCVISLPNDLILPRLRTLVPNLIRWSHEHKAHFKAKVKHIFERMIRRFGADVVEQWTPEEDRKLISNIRKTRERRKRKNQAGADAGEEGDVPRRTNRFESEYDEAIYGSESDEEEEISDDEVLGKAVAKGLKAKQTGEQYIVEEEDEPLDLLGRKAFAQVSSSIPAKKPVAPTSRRKGVNMDLDGKLVINADGDEDDLLMDFDDQGMVNGVEPGDGSLEGGINAYVNAIKGKDVAQRGQRGKLKFRNDRKSQKKAENEDEGDEMDIDEAAVKKSVRGNATSRGGRGKPMRRGLGAEKSRGGSATRDGGIRKGRGGAFKHGLHSRGRGRGRGRA